MWKHTGTSHQPFLGEKKAVRSKKTSREVERSTTTAPLSKVGDMPHQTALL